VLQAIPSDIINELNKNFMMFVVTAGLPYRASENKYLLKHYELINKISKTNYKPPSRKKIKRMVDQEA
jgi:hypothetical protein